MAQTVATQRGTGSSASYLGSATLFTQSGGNATRVIFNQFAATTSAGSVSYVYFTLNHIVSNGSSNVIGWYQSSSGSTFNSLQLCPNPNASNPTSTAQFSGTTSYSNNGILYGTSAAGAYPGDYVVLGFNYSNTTNGNITSYAPQNFWIGSGDSVLIRWYWFQGGNYPGVTYAYHFTTITES